MMLDENLKSIIYNYLYYNCKLCNSYVVKKSCNICSIILEYLLYKCNLCNNRYSKRFIIRHISNGYEYSDMQQLFICDICFFKPNKYSIYGYQSVGYLNNDLL